MVEINGNTATVEITKTDACGQCRNKNGCTSCVEGGISTARAEAVNDAMAKVGDTVVISAPSKSLMLYAALTYIVPVLSAFVVYAVLILTVKSSIVSLSAAFAVFVVSLLCAWFFMNRSAKTDTKIHVVRICGDR